MACKNENRTKQNQVPDTIWAAIAEINVPKTVSRLFWGADSQMQSNDLLQNNIEEFEWIVRNKKHPDFYGRYLTGDNCLTLEEIGFLHGKGCKIVPIYADNCVKQTEQQGTHLAKEIDARALELGIPEGTAIFLEIDENYPVSRDFMRSFAKSLMEEGYTPGFRTNTDAKFMFDREFSRGMQTDREIFKRCLIWAVSPTIKEYDGITTSHVVYPDIWMPYAPSGITRAEIAIWQYGAHCHPIEDDMGNLVTFNLDLVRNEQVIVDKMF